MANKLHTHAHLPARVAGASEIVKLKLIKTSQQIASLCAPRTKMGKPFNPAHVEGSVQSKRHLHETMYEYEKFAINRVCVYAYHGCDIVSGERNSPRKRHCQCVLPLQKSIQRLTPVFFGGAGIGAEIGTTFASIRC